MSAALSWAGGSGGRASAVQYMLNVWEVKPDGERLPKKLPGEVLGNNYSLLVFLAIMSLLDLGLFGPSL